MKDQVFNIFIEVHQKGLSVLNINHWFAMKTYRHIHLHFR